MNGSPVRGRFHRRRHDRSRQPPRTSPAIGPHCNRCRHPSGGSESAPCAANFPAEIHQHTSPPKIVAARSAGVWCDHKLGAPVSIEIGHDREFRRILGAATVDIRLQGMVRDRRHMLPASRGQIPFHDPKIVDRPRRIAARPICYRIRSRQIHSPEVVAPRSRRLDLKNQFGAAVPVDIGHPRRGDPM